MTRHGYVLTTWVFPPPDTWLSLIACAIFEAVLLFLCYHERGPELARRGPSILGRWLKPRVDAASRTSIKVNPPSSVAQSWRLGALHERFFRGARAGEQSTLREAGAVLGVGRPLTEEEFVALARASERAAYGFRCCGTFSECLFVAGVGGAIVTIGPAVYYLTTPIHEQLAEIITAVVDILRATPVSLLCLATLILSMALVCDGFRAPDKGIGARIALTGVAGAIASMFYSTTLHPWGEWYFFSFTEQSVLLLGFSAAALAPVAVKFDSSLAGFFAVVSMFYCAPFTLPPTAWLNAYMVGAMAVDGLFALAVALRLKTRTLQPFCSGIMAMGVFLLHLTLFFYSFEYYEDFWVGFRYDGRARDVGPHMVVQLLVLLGLLAGWLLGKAIGSDGFINNSRLFGVLYVFATIVSVSCNLPGYGGGYVGWAIVFLGLWRIGLYLHGNRDFVSSLWALDAALLRCRCSLGGGDGPVNAGFGRPGAELLLDEDPVFEPEMGMPRPMPTKQSSSASSELFRSRSAASYGVLS